MTRQVIDLRPYVGQQVAVDFVRESYGLNPNVIYPEAPLIVDTDRQTVSYVEVVLDEQGRAQLDPAIPDTILRRTVVKHFDEPIPEWP